MSQDPLAFSALWAARQEASGLGAEPGAFSPLQWVVRDPGASPLLGEGRHPSRTAGTSPDHGRARASSRKSWATQGGRVCGAPTKAGSRAGSAPRSGAAPGHPTGSLPPRRPPDQPLCCGWGVTQGHEGQQRGWGWGLGAPLGQGPPSQPSPRCVPLTPVCLRACGHKGSIPDPRCRRGGEGGLPVACQEQALLSSSGGLPGGGGSEGREGWGKLQAEVDTGRERGGPGSTGLPQGVA